ncbi:uncharacterized protein N7479_000314 [Penicillium vulpinum]|uniref:uncharacterized protein n=1 Tax=Penicillium vulpinum TaxID=29845 RepID=UPI002546F3A0|nr:uncharacterized protein N7479_000314 [Penicillium vulpinum]KAJ5970396.1 hypothetical protein N7479_000314 [Penicillium vulpinum]
MTGPRVAGIISSCNAYGVAQDGDRCAVFATRNKITVYQLCEEFPAFNMDFHLDINHLHI